MIENQIIKSDSIQKFSIRWNRLLKVEGMVCAGQEKNGRIERTLFPPIEMRRGCCCRIYSGENDVEKVVYFSERMMRICFLKGIIAGLLQAAKS